MDITITGDYRYFFMGDHFTVGGQSFEDFLSSHIPMKDRQFSEPYEAKAHLNTTVKSTGEVGDFGMQVLTTPEHEETGSVIIEKKEDENFRVIFIRRI